MKKGPGLQCMHTYGRRQPWPCVYINSACPVDVAIAGTEMPKSMIGKILKKELVAEKKAKLKS